MNVRQANISDLKDIVAVHISCFPNSFSTQLGSKLLEKMYLEYMKEAPELFLVAEDNMKIVGFVMGYYFDGKDSLYQFRKNNMIVFSLKTIQLLVCGNRPAWKKLRSLIKKGTTFTTLDNRINEYDNSQMADLLSICVKKEYRGTGVANHLIRDYETVVKEKGRKICTLTVADYNGRGIRFYEKNGYSVCRRADGCKTYYKQL